MDNSDWDSVLQFVTEPYDLDGADKPVAESLDSVRWPRVGEPTDSAVRRASSAILTSPQVPPTPPESNKGTPPEQDSSTLVSVSTTFYPGANLDSIPPDIVLLTADQVFFYVHSHILLAASSNGFRHLLPPPPQAGGAHLTPLIAVPEEAAVLNIVLHAIHGMSCAHYSPSFDDLHAAIVSLDAFGVSLKAKIAPTQPLFNLLLSHAPLSPLELYAVAAHYDLYDLAVSTSSHLLSLSLSTVTDELAERMGPLYLKRLFFLHFGRAEALKRLLLAPPHPHPPTSQCDFTEQKKLTRAWALASAYLAWDARPDLSTGTMESALNPLAEHLTCELCRSTLTERIKNLIAQWSIVRRTI